MPKPPKSSSLAPLLSVARRGLPFTDQDGQAFVRFESPCSDGYYILPVRSPEYRNWFFAQFFSEYDTLPTSQAFHAILHHLEAQADADPENRRLNVFRRVGARGPGYFPREILLDLANPACQFVEISATGWRTTTGRNAFLQTSRSTNPLPVPEPPAAEVSAAPMSPAPAALDALRPFLNVSSRADWLRCLAWLLSALRPHGPVPPLILQGPPSSGKTWAARVLRALIDPSTALLTPIPSSVRELLTLARHNWILAFDHISTLSPNLTDALCRLSSGVGISIRETGTPTSDPLLKSCKRPLLLTVTERFSCPADLAERALTVTFSPLPPESRSADSALGAAFTKAQPAILAALCTAVSRALASGTALRRLDEMNLPSGRCADALAWAMAAAPALDCTEEEMRQAFSSPPPHSRFGEPHPTVEAVVKFMEQRDHWTGTATDLLDLLQPSLPCHTATVLSRQLRSNSLVLATAGIALQFLRRPGGSRIVDLRAASCDASSKMPPPDASQNPDPSPQPPQPQPLIRPPKPDVASGAAANLVGQAVPPVKPAESRLPTAPKAKPRAHTPTDRQVSPPT